MLTVHRQLQRHSQQYGRFGSTAASQLCPSMSGVSVTDLTTTCRSSRAERQRSRMAVTAREYLVWSTESSPVQLAFIIQPRAKQIRTAHSHSAPLTVVNKHRQQGPRKQAFLCNPTQFDSSSVCNAQRPVCLVQPGTTGCTPDAFVVGQTHIQHLSP